MVSVTSGVQVLDRAVLVLDTVARVGPCSLADLVRETALARPTAYRVAVALERHGLLVRDGAGRFALGGRLARWSGLVHRRLSDVAAPVLARLAGTTGESAQLYVREADHRVCVAAHERSSGLRDTVPLGAVMPLGRGSGGKVLLAWADDATKFDVDASVLSAVRRRGWAESVGERERGVASVSAPVHDATNAVVAAISVSGPIERMSQRPGRRFAAAVRAAAESLSLDIAG